MTMVRVQYNSGANTQLNDRKDFAMSGYSLKFNISVSNFI